MDKNELRKSITTSEFSEWLNSVEESVSFPYINVNVRLKGVSSIFNFYSDQVNGWANLHEEIPSGFPITSDYFNRVLGALNSFISNIDKFTSESQLVNSWRNVKTSINNKLNSHPFTFEAPELHFLLETYKSRSKNTYNSAFNFIVHNKVTTASSEQFAGTLLAYEFLESSNSYLVDRKAKEFTAIEELRNRFSGIISEVNAQAVSNLAKQKKDYDSHIEQVERIKKDAEESIKKLIQLYTQDLKLKAPAEYWKERSETLHRIGKHQFVGMLVLIGIGAILIYIILLVAPEGLLTSFKDSSEVAIKWSVAFVTFISFLAYGIKVTHRAAFSSFHLARDANERHTLTFFYLSLIKDSEIDPDDRKLIIQSLFSRSDSGLLKDDSTPAMPGIVNRILSE